MKSTLSLSLLATIATTLASAAIALPPAEATTSTLAQAWGILETEGANDNSSANSEANSGPSTKPTPSSNAQKPMPSDSSRAERSQYRRVIEQTVNLVNDSAAQALAQRFGLNILNLTWEDTGRYKNSAVGPNISDMTIQVQQRDPSNGQYNLSLMPVIRHPNFSDETADVDLDKFFVLVGNEKGKELQRVSVRELLGDLRKYLHEPDSWQGRQRSLLAPRDSHALVSAQAAFLPIPKTGEATFNPVLFNYQSYQENPAVLTILATREGTSVTVIDNTRDSFEAGMTWGQRLFFNKNGDRTSLTGQRLSDFNASGNRSGANAPPATEAEGLNMVLLIQVPLKQKEQPRAALGDTMVFSEAMPQSAPMPAARASDVEAAVIGHGEVEGPFTEIDQLAIERDPRFPIRATVQFYKATSNGIVSEQDMQQIHDQISKVYSEGDYVGSLVTGGDTNRPSEYDGPKDEPPGWWSDFWTRNEENTGRSRWDVFRLWSRLRGE